MSIAEPIDPAPDWSLASTPELCCPLCEYNLRGLEVPRCPECGFAFAWSELIRGQREKHPYLFEHHPERNAWSFWKTYWNDCRPRRFWQTLSPAQEVRLLRLMVYWGISTLTLLLPFVVLFGNYIVDASHGTTSTYLVWTMQQSSGSGIVPLAPGPNPPISFSDRLILAWDLTVESLETTPLIAASLLILAWPWLTMGFLLIFSQSMRRAKINKRHVLRAVVYGTDFGFLMLIPLFIAKDWRGSGGDLLPIIAFACCGVTVYRLTFAYSRYLRFHLPFLTVLTSQIMVMLLVFAVLLQFELMR